MAEEKPKTQMHTVYAAETAILAAVESGQDPEELRELVSSAGVEALTEFRQNRSSPSPTTYFGHGKAEELGLLVAQLGANVVVTDDDLSPTQQRNLEEVIGTRVVDRTQLILDIFAQRAHTKEGKLQVELAQLTYLLPRISAQYTKFERQQGGIGMRGPGETKLEADRQRIRKRISDLEDEIEEVSKQRGVARSSRRKTPFPSAALVGYTSAGKSTLLNVLTGADVFVDAKLFATLDPTTRRVLLPDGWGVLLTDTVGFIRRLPHHLVAAFRATLEEVTQADLLVHVMDAASPEMEAHGVAVDKVLKELGAGSKPRVTVLNKADLVKDQFWLREYVATHEDSVYISALNRDGLNHLLVAVERALQRLLVPMRLALPYAEGHLLTLCHEGGQVTKVEYNNDHILVEGRFNREVAGRLRGFQA
ncbi:MAG TPA: GTPase HflX [Armatimonadota bacterium]